MAKSSGNIVSASTLKLEAALPTPAATSRALRPAEIPGPYPRHVFGQATRRAIEAGFDGGELHGVHGFLRQNFLSSFLAQLTALEAGRAVLYDADAAHPTHNTAVPAHGGSSGKNARCSPSAAASG